MLPRARVIPDAELTTFGFGLNEVRDATVSDLAFFGFGTRLRQLRFREANHTGLAPNRAGGQLTGIAPLAWACSSGDSSLPRAGTQVSNGGNTPRQLVTAGSEIGTAGHYISVVLPMMFRQSEELSCQENRRSQ